MKGTKIYFFVLLSVLLMLPNSINAQEEALHPGQALVLEKLILRSEPNGTAAELGEVPAGVLVNIIEVDGMWDLVQYEELEGWTIGVLRSRRLVNVEALVPLPRGYHRLVYDVESNKTILVNGMTSARHFPADTWIYDVESNSWENMEPEIGPPAGEGPLAYDSESDRVIYFQGSDELASGRESQTWAYDFNSNTWTHMEPAQAPPAILGARMAYDSESDRMILYGGLMVPLGAMRFHYKTWAYDYNTNTWEDLRSDDFPPARNYHVMAYDPEIDRVILFGGDSEIRSLTQPYDTIADTWTFDYNSNTWNLIETEVSPPSRVYSSMVYSPDVKGMILFGGVNELESQIFNDMWTFNPESNTWTEVKSESAPGARGWHDMVAVANSPYLVVFGGGDERTNFDFQTWRYDIEANVWTQTTP